MICTNCGADFPDGSKFCPKCGKPLEITQDLIDRAKANDSTAQTELYERTYKTVYSRIRAKVPDEDTAMDIMQETYLHAFTSLDNLQKAEAFPSWLLTIANRRVCDWYRKNKKEQENIQMSQLEHETDDTISDEDDLLDQPEYREDFSPDESLDRAETGRLLSEILDTLPEDQRIILTMRYYDEMSLNEISEELGVNLSTVKTRLTAGKKKVEAKVLELEKSGTKLYSLGPVAFLVYLLHHMELFVPEIPVNTIIGLTAAGVGGAAAAHVTAGAAAKTAVAAAAKGVSVKVMAIIAAAVVVVGGGITTAVIATNHNDNDQITAENLEESESPAKVSAQTSESTPDPQPDSPSNDVVYDLTAPLADWAANVIFDYDVANSSLGEIKLNTNRAVELAGLAAYCDGDRESTDLSIDQVDTSLKKMFGSQYQVSGFTNTVSDSDLTEYDSAFSTEYSKYIGLGWLYKTEDGSFHIEFCPERYDPLTPTGVTVNDIVPNDDSSYTAIVEYDIDNSVPYDGIYNSWSLDICFKLIPDEDAEYGWVITSFSLSDEYNQYFEEVAIQEPPSEDVVHKLVDPLGFWSVNAMGDAAIAAGPITPTLNQAAELAAAAYYGENRGQILSGDDFDMDAPIPYYSYILPESEIRESLRNRFGPEFDLSNFTNTINEAGTPTSAFGDADETNNYLQMMLFKLNGNYEYSELATDGMYFPDSTVIRNIVNSDSDDDYVVDITYEYAYYTFETIDGEIHHAARDVEYVLSPNDGSDYGWIIKQITYENFHDL